VLKKAQVCKVKIKQAGIPIRTARDIAPPDLPICPVATICLFIARPIEFDH